MKNKNYDLISVIVPCFNSGKTLERTLNSILSQTWDQKEIILVNDGSTDKYTLEVINKFKKNKNIVIVNQSNLGLSAARNIGCKYANGDYLYFIDSDDWIEPETLDLMYKKIISTKGISFVFSDLIIEGKYRKVIKKEYNFFEQLFINQLPYSIFISRKTWSKYGGYDENMKLGYEDWELNIRLGSKSQFGARLALPLFHYNVSYSGMLISKSSKYHAQIYNYIIKKNKKLFYFKNLLNNWIKWRRSKSSYPLIIFFPFFLIINVLPSKLFTIFFVTGRNIKWLFSRNKIVIFLKKYFIPQFLYK